MSIILWHQSAADARNRRAIARARATIFGDEYSDTVRLRVFSFSPRVYEPGIETHTIDGVHVKVYSPAKTIADCFYYQRAVGLDVCLEALRDAWRSRKVTMDELFHFAEVRNVKGTMLPYLNTLL